MSYWVLFGVVVLLLLVVAAGVILARRPKAAPPPARAREPVFDATARAARRRAADSLGTELIERRIMLDSRRGSLSSDNPQVQELEDMAARLHRGEISAEEYEAAKLRLLG